MIETLLPIRHGDEVREPITVDLEIGTVEGPGVSESFEMDDFTRHRFLYSPDDIGLTLTYEDELEKFESTRPGYKPKVC